VTSTTAPRSANERTENKRPPGRPRSEQAHEAILRSVLELLGEVGFRELSIESVAELARVSKATVYRWWPSKAALVADAFHSSAVEELHFSDSGSVLKDISEQMIRLVKVFRSSRGKLVSALIAAGQSDPELIDAFRNRFLFPRRREAYQTVQRAVDRGELSKDVDFDLLLDTLYGPIYMRFLIRHDSLTREFAIDLCKLVLGPLIAETSHARQRLY
jgi:AcrR family transcriptional regulator